MADCLSCYYKTDGLGDKHPDHKFVSADTQLDLDGELLPIRRYVKVHAATARRSCRLAKKLEHHVLESNQMNERPCESTAQPVASENMPPDQLPLAIKSGADRESLRARVERTFNLADTIRKYYREDPTFAKVLANPRE